MWQAVLPERPAVLPMGPAVAAAQTDVSVLIEERQLPLQARRIAPVVGILARNQLSLGQSDSQVRRRRDPALRFPAEADARVPPGAALQTRLRLPVPAAV